MKALELLIRTMKLSFLSPTDLAGLILYIVYKIGLYQFFI